MTIYLINSGVTTPITHVYKAKADERLDGTLTLGFSVFAAEYAAYISSSTQVIFNSQNYDIASINFYQKGQAAIIEVECEHISYRLNSTVSSGIQTSGNPYSILGVILSGTSFSAATGTMRNGSYTVQIHGNMYRRNAIYQLAALCNGEIYYSGWSIGISAHIGSTVSADLPSADYVGDIEYFKNFVGKSETITLSYALNSGRGLGDNVHIKYTPYGLDKDTRIIGRSFDPYSVSGAIYTLGSYKPDISEYITGANASILDLETSVSSLKSSDYYFGDGADGWRSITVSGSDKSYVTVTSQSYNLYKMYYWYTVPESMYDNLASTNGSSVTGLTYIDTSSVPTYVLNQFYASSAYDSDLSAGNGTYEDYSISVTVNKGVYGNDDIARLSDSDLKVKGNANKQILSYTLKFKCSSSGMYYAVYEMDNQYWRYQFTLYA